MGKCPSLWKSVAGIAVRVPNSLLESILSKAGALMKMNPKSGQYFVLIAVAFVLVMLGTRFVTLRFGQVFPDQATQDRQRIASLEARVQELRTHDAKMAEVYNQLAALKEKNARLANEAQAAKNVPPKVIYQPVEVAAEETAEAPEPKPKHQSGTVHRGDSREKVRRVFGRPESVRNSFISEQWSYGGMKSVTFNTDGQVSEWYDMPIEP